MARNSFSTRDAQQWHDALGNDAETIFLAMPSHHTNRLLLIIAIVVVTLTLLTVLVQLGG